MTIGIIREIELERRRQISAEGYTTDHDDAHDRGELAGGAAYYAIMSTRPRFIPSGLWPFRDPPKAADRRRELVKAGAMIVAEIERLDRLAAKTA